MAEKSGLSINLDVIESMAAMAALEVDGVSSMASRKLDIKKAISPSDTAAVWINAGVISASKTPANFSDLMVKLPL